MVNIALNLDKDITNEVKDLLRKDKNERMKYENIPFHLQFKGMFDVLKGETNVKQGVETFVK